MLKWSHAERYIHIKKASPSYSATRSRSQAATHRRRPRSLGSRTITSASQITKRQSGNGSATCSSITKRALSSRITILFSSRSPHTFATPYSRPNALPPPRTRHRQPTSSTPTAAPAFSRSPLPRISPKSLVSSSRPTRSALRRTTRS